MRYLVLACDYDETLAEHGRVSAKTVAALSRLVESGRKLVLVTGRLLDDLLAIFSEVHLFERVIAENGALLYDPTKRTRRRLADPPPPEFEAKLREYAVEPIGVGEVIIATREPYETIVLETIRELGMGHQVIFNKGAVMILPSGVDKGTGLEAALEELSLSFHNVVGAGDAENDHAFLRRCEFAVAVHNALPLVQQNADWVTTADAGAGIVELVRELLESDLARFEGQLARHEIVLGKTEDGREFRVPPYGGTVLVAGPSGSGKSQTTTALLERAMAKGYQACLVDPEGDYGELEGVISVGEPDKPPSVDEVLQLLKQQRAHVAVNLLGIPLADRPAFFAGLLPRLQSLRAHTGRPHWVVVDEAHHLLPSSWVPAPTTLPQNLGSFVAVTVHADQVSPAILKATELVIAVGADPGGTLAAFAAAADRKAPRGLGGDLNEGEVIAWKPASSEPPRRIQVAPAEWVHRRHRRKYAQGDLGPDRSFYFRGPEGKLNLKAQNLLIFLQISDGLDDATWEYHLRRGDYSRWFGDHIKDESLAQSTGEIERDPAITAAGARSLIRRAIEEHYTLPA